MTDYIFIFSSGMKTGSTLIQRFLNSHKDILIWGENLSLEILYNHSKLEIDVDIYNEGLGLGDYIRLGYDAHTPRLFMNSTILSNYIKEYIENILHCKELDITKSKSIFGMKQTWYTCDYMLLLDKYLGHKNLKYIYITRNIIDCYLSQKKIWGSSTLIHQWTEINNSVMKLEQQLKNIIILRYEDIIQDPLNNFGLKVCNHLNMNIEEFDMNVFNNRLGSSEININDKEELTEVELSNLFTKNTIECCKRFNYSYDINDYLIKK